MSNKPSETAAPGGGESREKVIVRTGLIGVGANLFLAAFKAFVGVLSNSIAVILDAVNNLTDAISSVVTIIGAKISGKKPDRKHPLGHGRVEYISALIVSAIVLYAGITALIESIKKIIFPEKPDYSTAALIVLGGAVIVKLLLGFYFIRVGKRIRSSALTASGKDAFFDAVLSFSVLVSAILFMTVGLPAEAYVAAIISIFIIRSGVMMMFETISDILGKRADPELTSEIKRALLSFPEVIGAYDLFVNNFGPERNYASVHLELKDTMTVGEVDVLTREVQKKVYLDTGVIMTAVGVYSYNTSDDEAAAMRNKVLETVLSYKGVLQMHGFFADVAKKEMRFDVVLSFDVDHAQTLQQLYAKIEELYPSFAVSITADVDISD